MKFLDLPPIARINTFLEHVDVGDSIVKGNLEAYSCKLAGLDKKMSRSLDAELESGSSPLELSQSPLGPLAESSSRKTLIYLILTLNHIYPDYDFSLLRAHHFIKEEGVGRAEETVDSHLLEVGKVWAKTPGLGESPFLECLWSSIEEAITLKDCDVYSYKSDDLESDPFGETASVWSFNYFFYNKKMKRILYLACRAKSKAAGDEEEESETVSKQYYTEDSDTDVRYGMANQMDV